MLKLPLISLILLYATYAVFGWRVSDAADAWQLVAGVLVLGIDLILTAPLRFIRFAFGSWVSSDRNAFVAVIGVAFAAVFALTWLQHFIRLFVLLSAGALARLELQRCKFNRWQSASVLAIASLSGYASGLAGNQLWQVERVQALRAAIVRILQAIA
ncbi:hypothetical protein KR51_00026760 [Rubidibacter lacunae KORDI 51-2]|uniref:Uncharacterized protein n=1 Tax=Rubidibacter lacunae KORDI 51-2 TaxID=582515 RepID=U5DGH0_9CHRO|nr:hypothetical protein [Rubidibacter lacunae]ERN40691.1 hypothetical protein KR51_00026760 [Rubidibacter lacunae KORDI 51-2]